MPHDESLYPPLAEDAVTDDDVRTSLEQVRPLIDHLRSEVTKAHY